MTDRSETRPAPRLPIHPAHPERICWGCPRYCADDDLRCGADTVRASHPSELFGDDWLEFAGQHRTPR